MASGWIMSQCIPGASGSVPWRSAYAVVGLYLAAVSAAAVLFPSPPGGKQGPRLALCLLAVEAVGLGLSAPLLAARGRERLVRLIVLPLCAMAALGLALVAAAVRGGVGLLPLAWAHLFLLAFAWLIASLTTALHVAGLRAAQAQFLGTLVALFMLGQIFIANSLVEFASGEAARMLAIDAVLWTNPWLIAGGSILEADPLRSEHLYEWSVIIYYGFQYPLASVGAAWLRSLLLAAAYGAPGSAALALATTLRNRSLSVRTLDTSCPHRTT